MALKDIPRHNPRSAAVYAMRSSRDRERPRRLARGRREKRARGREGKRCGTTGAGGKKKATRVFQACVKRRVVAPCVVTAERLTSHRLEGTNVRHAFIETSRSRRLRAVPVQPIPPRIAPGYLQEASAFLSAISHAADYLCPPRKFAVPLEPRAFGVR